MKNHFFRSAIFLILFFTACGEAEQNQNRSTDEKDTSAQIISMEKNSDLILEEKENFDEEKQVVQNSHSSESDDQKKEKSEPPAKKKIPENVPEKVNNKTTEAEIQNTILNKDPNAKIINTQKETKTEKKQTSELIKTDNPQTTLNTTKKEDIKSTPPAFSHDKFDRLLRKYVSTTGKVNYNGFQSEKKELDSYLKLLEENPIQSNWSRSKKMVYWINAYNAFTIKMIVDNYPVSSITKLHGGKPWDVKWIKLDGQSYNLNNIENDILRPTFKDARIHFAVNCAAKSCPPILNQAWTESNLKKLLEKQARAFINNPKFNSIKKNEVEISKIFEWYAVDFGNIIDYLNKYSITEIKKNAKVKYREYDWALNE